MEEEENQGERLDRLVKYIKENDPERFKALGLHLRPYYGHTSKIPELYRGPKPIDIEKPIDLDELYRGPKPITVNKLAKG